MKRTTLFEGDERDALPEKASSPPPRAEGNGNPVRSLVRAYRGILGVASTAKDGGVIAGLFGKYGQARVLTALEEFGPSIAAADNPLLMLAAKCRDGRQTVRAGPRTARPVAAFGERAAEVLDELGRARLAAGGAAR